MSLTYRLRELTRPETLALVVIPTMTLILLAALGLLDRHLVSVHFWATALYLLFFGWQFFFVVSLVVLAYLWVRLIGYALRRSRSAASTPGAATAAEQPRQRRFPGRWRAAGGLALLTAAYAYALAVHVVAMDALSRASPQRVAWASELMMRADHGVFGVYLPFAMHQQEFFRVLTHPMLISYVGLSSALSLVFTALFVMQAERFREYVLTFLLIMYLGLPFWFALPAISPSEAYRVKKLGAAVPADVARGIEAPVARLHPAVLEFCERIEPFESDAAAGRFAVTTFPSMHVAWGLLIAWFGIAFYRPLAVVLVPWALLNALGAIYSLQHYAVDIVAAVPVTVLAVAMVRSAAALERRCGLQLPVGYSLLGFLREDVASFGRGLRRLATRVTSAAGQQ